ncbi:MAG: MFS transporter [Streptosporangiaceae bacterium]|nr:MFS transporter [Streptosporangiaceae bacterium]
MASDQLTRETSAAKLEPRAFANKDFIKLWAGESVSLIGSQVTLLTMPLVAILTLNATVAQVGLLNALRFVPVLVLSLLAGVWLDRRRRRPVLIACALGNAILIGLVPMAKVTGLLSMGLLYVVVTLAGLLSMTFDVGAMSYVPDLVGRDQLADANGKLQASLAFAGVSGPGLAGILVGLITAPITLTVDAVSFLFSAAGLIAIRKPEPPPEVPEDRPSVRQSMSEGLRAVWGSKLLSALLLQSAALNLFFGGYATLFIVYAVRVVHLSPFELGIVLVSQAAGGLVGTTTAGRVRKRLGLGRLMLANTAGFSLPLLLLLVPTHAGLFAMTVFMTAQLVYGCNIGMFNVNAVTLRQMVTPRRVLARMNAAYRMVIFGIAPLGMSLGGVLGGAIGLRAALAVSLILMTSPLLGVFFSPVYRLSEMPAAPPN